jgi:hypothetical protein
MSNPKNCSSDFYAISAANQPQDALAILLAAYIAGTKVSIFVSDTVCDANTGRISVTDVGTSP